MNSKMDRQADWQTERREKGGGEATETDRQNETNSKRHRQAGREGERYNYRQADREGERHNYRQADREGERHNYRLADRHTERASERERERERQTDRDAKIRLIMTSRLTQGENGRNVVQRSSRKTLGMQYEK